MGQVDETILMPLWISFMNGISKSFKFFSLVNQSNMLSGNGINRRIYESVIARWGPLLSEHGVAVRPQPEAPLQGFEAVLSASSLHAGSRCRTINRINFGLSQPTPQSKTSQSDNIPLQTLGYVRVPSPPCEIRKLVLKRIN